MNRRDLSRRSFLRASGAVVAGTVLVSQIPAGLGVLTDSDDGGEYGVSRAAIALQDQRDLNVQYRDRLLQLAINPPLCVNADGTYNHKISMILRKKTERRIIDELGRIG